MKNNKIQPDPVFDQALSGDLDAETFIGSLFHEVFRLGYSVAFWRLPLETTIHGIVHLRNTPPDWQKPEVESLSPGFLFSPYNNDDNSRALFIPADIHFIIKSYRLSEVQLTNDPSVNLLASEFASELEKKLDVKRPTEWSYYENPARKFFNPDRDFYLRLIHRAMEQIGQGEFEKVVPSRSRVIRLSQQVNLASSFIRLCKNNPNAFLSIVTTPLTGTWVGASPEMLISVRQNEIFETVSIAGTQEYKPSLKLSEVSWTQKEIEEQAMVSRYIINCFKRIRLREFTEYGPKTVPAGSLAHLKTKFTVNMREVNFPQLGTVMLKLLHPTSAVCGMPKEKAQIFLLENEGYDREFYSGYLGPVNLENHTSIFVNIRCANLYHDQAVFYAGAGVTSDSIPEKEWHETEAKIDTVSKYILPGC